MFVNKTLESTTTQYAGGYIYENSSLKFINHTEGYIEPDGGGGYDYVYQYKDHLGNVRLSYSDANADGAVDNTEIVEESNYYPFGLKHRGYNDVVNGMPNKFLTYNGKEFEESLGLNLYEMDFRQYDPALGRFNTIDPLGEERNWLTPYNFVQNNPITRVDPSGLLDDYGVDQNGNITLIEETNDDFDRLYSVTTDENGELVRDENGEVVRNDTNDDDEVDSDDSVTVSKDEEGSSVLSELSQIKADGSGFRSRWASTNKMSQAFDVFNFVVNNSDVEWSIAGFSDKTYGVQYVLGTYNMSNKTVNLYNLGIKGTGLEKMIFDLHSHPDTPGASGYSTKGYMYGDKLRQYRHYQQLKKLGLSLPLYYIYHKPSSKLYRYTPRKGNIFIKEIKKSSDFYTGKYK